MCDTSYSCKQPEVVTCPYSVVRCMKVLFQPGAINSCCMIRSFCLSFGLAVFLENLERTYFLGLRRNSMRETLSLMDLLLGAAHPRCSSFVCRGCGTERPFIHDWKTFEGVDLVELTH